MYKTRCSLNVCTYQLQVILPLDPCQVQALASVEGPFYFAVEVLGYVGGHWAGRNLQAHSEDEAENWGPSRVDQSAEMASEIKETFQ